MLPWYVILSTGPPDIIVVQERVALVCDYEYQSTGYNSGQERCAPDDDFIYIPVHRQ